MCRRASRVREQTSTTLSQEHVEEGCNDEAEYADADKNFVERDEDENEKRDCADDAENESRRAVMLAHPEREAEESYEQEKNQQRQQHSVVNQKPSPIADKIDNNAANPRQQSAVKIEPTTPTLSVCLFQELVIPRSTKVWPELCNGRWRRFSTPRPWW